MITTEKQRNSIRVAFLGNMNNNHFVLTRYLRDYGIDVSLLLFDTESEHFHPECDSYDTAYRNWTAQLTWGGSGSFLFTSRGKIARDLDGYDVLIGCGHAPAYCHKAGRILDVMVPYGADIWTLTQFRVVRPHRFPSAWLAVDAQRRGLKACTVLHSPTTIDLYERQFVRFAAHAVRWYEGIPMVHAPTYDTGSLEHGSPQSAAAQRFSEIRKSAQFMLMSHSRHIWCSENDPSAKGNDRLLKGWSMFCKQMPNLSKRLVLFEYGRDVAKSKKLAAALGVEDSVVWLPMMQRKDLMSGLRMTDMVAAEFVHSWTVGGVLYESLVARKPILTYRDETHSSAKAEQLYPIYNARTSEDIARCLNEYMADPETGRRIGQQGRQWYEATVDKAIRRYLMFIETRAAEIGRRA